MIKNFIGDAMEHGITKVQTSGDEGVLYMVSATEWGHNGQKWKKADMVTDLIW